MFRVYFRTYDTADGWIAVACGSHGLRVRFLQATGLTDDQLEANAEEVIVTHRQSGLDDFSRASATRIRQQLQFN